MARSSNSEVIAVAETKRRLLELGKESSLLRTFLASPVVWTTVLKASGVLFARLFRSPRKNDDGEPQA